MRRGLSGSVSPSGRFPDLCAVARPPSGECSEFSTALLSFMPARPQTGHTGGRGMALPGFRLKSAAFKLTPAAGNALSALSSRLRVPAPSRKADEKMGRRCSPLLLSAGAFLCHRAVLSGRSVAGKPADRHQGEAPHGRSQLPLLRRRFLKYRSARAAAPWRRIPGRRTGSGIARERAEL